MKRLKEKGFTLVETLIAIGIFISISYLLANFVKNIFFLNADLSNSLSAQFDARQILKKMVFEIRSASPSSLGAYPIASVSTSSITFYTDIDNNGTKDRIRYFLQGSDFKHGVLKPTGSPLTYNPANESVDTIAHNIVNSTSTPIFDYFDENYTGTSTPLASPVNISSIRLVRVTIIIEVDPNRLPAPLTVSSQVMLRNLKDNL